MSATFDPKLPTLRDHIRLHLGDTHSQGEPAPVDDPVIQDEVIDALLANYSYSEALARCAEYASAVYAQSPNEFEEKDGIRVRFSYKVTLMQSLAERARSGKIAVPNSSRQSCRRFTAISQMTAGTSDLYRGD